MNPPPSPSAVRMDDGGIQSHGFAKLNKRISVCRKHTHAEPALLRDLASTLLQYAICLAYPSDMPRVPRRVRRRLGTVRVE